MRRNWEVKRLGFSGGAGDGLGLEVRFWKDKGSFRVWGYVFCGVFGIAFRSFSWSCFFSVDYAG